MPTEKLLFIDANIWLDFYRVKKDTGVKLLKHVEAVTHKLIVTYQLEVEFKKNRQRVLVTSWKELEPPKGLGVPNIIADARTSKSLNKRMREAEKQVKTLKKLLMRTMASPSRYDPVIRQWSECFIRIATCC
jgi:hypothetical protein